MLRPVLGAMLLLSLVIPAASVGHAAPAATCLTCLGGLTRDKVMYTPLGTYKRQGSTIPRSGGKPLVLLVTALFDAQSASERWATVKALSQFGSFTKISAGASNPAMPKQPKQPIPTFNLAHASYHSAYLTFHHRDIEDATGHVYQKVSRADTPLVARFQYIPVLIAGNYYLDRPMVAPAEFVQNGRAYSFETIRAALARHDTGYNQLGQVTGDINTETNILVSILCHATGGKPTATCTAPIVRSLLKHIS